MNWLVLFFEFATTGLFAIGGGLATVPFVMEIGRNFSAWFTERMVPDMLAVAQILPGAIGVNLAAYSGLKAGASFAAGSVGASIGGALLAAVALITPCVIIIEIISRVLQSFKNSPWVKAVFRTLRPAACGILLAAAWGVWKMSMWGGVQAGTPWYSIFNWKEVVLFAVLVFGVLKFKLHPAVYIAIGAVAGIVFGL
jgi:chromate transporter